MIPRVSRFWQAGVIGVLVALCCLAPVQTTHAEAPLPEAPSLDSFADEARLGGEATLSPSLVPDSLLSRSDESVAGPVARVAQSEERAGPALQGRPTTADVPAAPLTPAELQTRRRISTVLNAYRNWQLNTRDHSPWELMHAIIAGGISTTIRQDGPRGKPVTAIGWLCFNRPAAGRRLFYLTRDGFGTLQGPGLEGHRGQLLAVLAQASVKPDYPIQIDGRSFTIADLIEHEKRTCYAGTELTFKLIALNHYLEQDAQWENDRGQPWDIPRLIREEMAQPIRGATCGGTHRLTGLSLAVKRQIASGQPLSGEYARAARYIRDYHAYTFRLQNRDGSFSTEWFHGRGANPDPQRRVRTTGHILEWLCYSLPDSEIRGARVRAAANHLARVLWEHRAVKWDNGPLGHALHALVLYDQRVFQQDDIQADWISAAPQDTSAPRDSR